MEKKLDVNNTRILYWTNPGGNTWRVSSYTATNQENYKLHEPDMRDIAREVRTNS